ncbi:hypothetical protein F5J12DRAFT_170801 [Pisolithus orientalis]|uniref:uncharacterized protein n=1 Tax=Pisolithus orientalis TaxID=936130 RepID=UPI0022251993|nr:uncharacterized protein F5J12DRAFT_170801 [Pisolithus orientalis]KAI6003310.1 hypothetical protein F5J12DRAFT_170801 [Pisolithus orientalis]
MPFSHNLLYPSASRSELVDRTSHINYDRQLDIHSKVQEIKVLKAKLDATEDEDEQRALEEDITGRILWLCWCGICAEVDQLLPMVVGYIQREGNIAALYEIYQIMTSRKYAEPDDNQAHFQRVMLDAGAGTSKHQLLLAARAAEQAKWSDTNKDIPTIDTRGSAPSTSFHASSLSSEYGYILYD